MPRPKKSKRIQLRSEPAFVARVHAVAETAGYPSTADFFREAVEEKIQKLSRKFPQINNPANQSAPQSEMAVTA